MLMSPDSSSADLDPIPINSCHSVVHSMIQVPECTQSHGGPANMLKSHHIQVVDYTKIEPLTNGYLSPTKMVHTPIFQQKSAMTKAEEDLNLGNQLLN